MTLILVGVQLIAKRVGSAKKDFKESTEGGGLFPKTRVPHVRGSQLA